MNIWTTTINPTTGILCIFPHYSTLQFPKTNELTTILNDVIN